MGRCVQLVEAGHVGGGVACDDGDGHRPAVVRGEDAGGGHRRVGGQDPAQLHLRAGHAAPLIERAHVPHRQVLPRLQLGHRGRLVRHTLRHVDALRQVELGDRRSRSRRRVREPDGDVGVNNVGSVARSSSSAMNRAAASP